MDESGNKVQSKDYEYDAAEKLGLWYSWAFRNVFNPPLELNDIKPIHAIKALQRILAAGKDYQKLTSAVLWKGVK